MNQKFDKSVLANKNAIKFAPSELLFKFLVLGDYGVGKTSIVKRYAEGTYSSNYKITIGADFALKTIYWDNQTKINVQLWDIAGHERFGYLTRVYYKYSVAAVIVFDLSRIDTFESVEKWLTDLRSKVTLPNSQPIPIILLANKCDVAAANIPTVEIQKLCSKYNILTWYLTSAKENLNIEEAFWCLTQKAMENKNIGYEVNDKNDNIILCQDDGIEKTNKSKLLCCG